MSERTLRMGMQSDAAKKMAAHKIRLQSLISSLRMALVTVEPTEINQNAILSLATDIHEAKGDYDEQHAIYLEQCRELGEKP
jgi:hypothetical protein